MYRYRVRGLTLASDVIFPELAGLENDRVSTASVRALLANRREIPPAPADLLLSTTLPDGTPWLNCARVENGYLLRYVGLADFVVDRCGSEIVCCRTDSGVTIETIRHLVLDQVLPMVLNLRGREAIHATAIVTPGGACAFMGPAGAGKSTLAASFSLAGFPSLGDDCLALADEGGIIAIPGYPGMRLWTDSAGALAQDFRDSAPVADYTRKRRMLAPRLRASFASAPVPLVRVYKLVRQESSAHRADQLSIEPYGPREALIELISCSFPLDVTDSEMLARHFRFMERVASQVPVKKLQIPNDFESLPRVREAILNDISAQ